MFLDFVKNSCISVHQGSWAVVFFFVVFLSGLGVSNAGFIRVWECLFLSYFVDSFRGATRSSLRVGTEAERWLLSQRTRVRFLEPTGNSQPAGTPCQGITEDLIPSSDFHGHCTCVVHVHAGRNIHINKGN